jgi:hypothetical protein
MFLHNKHGAAYIHVVLTLTQHSGTLLFTQLSYRHVYSQVVCLMYYTLYRDYMFRPASSHFKLYVINTVHILINNTSTNKCTSHNTIYNTY